MPQGPHHVRLTFLVSNSTLQRLRFFLTCLRLSGASADSLLRSVVWMTVFVGRVLIHMTLLLTGYTDIETNTPCPPHSGVPHIPVCYFE